GHAGYAGDGPHCHATAAVALKADADADADGPGVGDPLAQIHDRFSRKPGDRSYARWRKLEDALAKGLPTDGVPRDEFAVLPAFGKHDVQQAKREGRVRARHECEMPVARRRSPRAN